MWPLPHLHTRGPCLTVHPMWPLPHLHTRDVAPPHLHTRGPCLTIHVTWTLSLVQPAPPQRHREMGRAAWILGAAFFPAPSAPGPAMSRGPNSHTASHHFPAWGLWLPLHEEGDRWSQPASLSPPGHPGSPTLATVLGTNLRPNREPGILCRPGRADGRHASMQPCPQKEPAGWVAVCAWATWGPTLGLAPAEV